MEDGPVVYDKIPKEVIVTRENIMDVISRSHSGWNPERGQINLLPISETEAKPKIPIFPELSTMLTGHGNIKT